jgi:hypothetical protein
MCGSARGSLRLLRGVCAADGVWLSISVAVCGSVERRAAVCGSARSSVTVSAGEVMCGSVCGISLRLSSSVAMRAAAHRSVLYTMWAVDTVVISEYLGNISRYNYCTTMYFVYARGLIRNSLMQNSKTC